MGQSRRIRSMFVGVMVLTGAVLAGQGGGRRSAGDERVTLPALPPPPRPRDFTEAKRELRRIADASLQRDVYCGCRFDAHMDVDFTDCEAAHPYSPIEEHADRAGRIEWDHVLPASWLYHERPCFQDRPPHTEARAYCREHDPAFRNAEGDMHNLLPAIGQLNALRENYPYAVLEGENHVAGCDFELAGHAVEPRDAARGDLARAMLYAAATYAVPLRRDLHALLLRWHGEDPPTDAERRRNDFVERVQGNRNPYVDGRR